MRPPVCEHNGLQKRAWTPEEDQMLVTYVTRYGTWNWTQIPKFAGLSSSGKSCRLRWMNYLRPGVRRGNITKEEEETIISLQNKLGNRWSAIAAKFPGRTGDEIKNHWHTYLKKLSNNIPKSSTQVTEKSNETENIISPTLSEGLNQETPSNGPTLPDSPNIDGSLQSYSMVHNIESLFSSDNAFESFWTQPFSLENMYYVEDREGRFVDPLFKMNSLTEDWIREPLSQFDSFGPMCPSLEQIAMGTQGPNYNVNYF